MYDILFEAINEHPVHMEDIRALEAQFHFQMPEDMRQFYLENNGGFLHSGIYIDPEGCRITEFNSIAFPFHEHIPTMDTLLKWQEMDGFIPMQYIPFCNDEAGDSYYIRTDAEGYGKVYYLCHEFWDEFEQDPEDSLVASSFSDFLEKMRTSLEQAENR